MSTELIINASLPETRIALMENGEIQELQIERASEKGIVGNIYKGRVTRVLPGMQAAFVDIGLEKAAFLYVDDVFVHSEIWEEAEEEAPFPNDSRVEAAQEASIAAPTESEVAEANPDDNTSRQSSPSAVTSTTADINDLEQDRFESDSDSDSDPENPISMAADPENPDAKSPPPGTLAPETSGAVAPDVAPSSSPRASRPSGRHSDRGRRGHGRTAGGRGGSRRSPRGGRSHTHQTRQAHATPVSGSDYTGSTLPLTASPEAAPNHAEEEQTHRRHSHSHYRREPRSRDRRVRPLAQRSLRGQANIQNLLQEGQEVLVQVAKDPIATKGARLTCHISLPGRHLVCMPTIDHVGVSRRIERDDERRRLRDFVDRNRPKNIGFIVRTASARGQAERRLKQDIDYLTRLWTEIREKAATTSAPALVYEDLNAILRSIRDWVTEDIHKIIVDSRYHYNEILRFVSHFMPSIKQKVELYHGDIPIFDAYNISTELSRALERKVWLKSGGYIVIDQAEALVAIDVNTGRYVGKKNLEDTILKTNLEAAQEIAYQLRLRNCGGIIILDFIDMERDESRLRVYRALDEVLKKDRARPSILKISELGLVEMTRKRTRDTIIRTLCESCSHCEGKGYIKNKTTVAYEVLREVERTGIERDSDQILIQGHPDIIDILAIDARETLDGLERRYRKQIFLQAAPHFHPEQFEVITEKQQRLDALKQTTVTPKAATPAPVVSNERAGATHEEESEPEAEEPPTDEQLPSLKTAEPNEAEEEPLRKAGGGDAVAATAGAAGAAMAASRPPLTASRSPDDFIDEEDRLAFLRAQAAQDAALAHQTASASSQRTQTRPGGFSRGKTLGSWGGSGRGKPRRGGGGGGGMRRGGGGRGTARYSRPDQGGGRYSYSNNGNYPSYGSRHSDYSQRETYSAQGGAAGNALEPASRDPNDSSNGGSRGGEPTGL